MTIGAQFSKIVADHLVSALRRGEISEQTLWSADVSPTARRLALEEMHGAKHAQTLLLQQSPLTQVEDELAETRATLHVALSERDDARAIGRSMEEANSKLAALMKDEERRRRTAEAQVYNLRQERDDLKRSAAGYERDSANALAKLGELEKMHRELKSEHNALLARIDLRGENWADITAEGDSESHTVGRSPMVVHNTDGPCWCQPAIEHVPAYSECEESEGEKVNPTQKQPEFWPMQLYPMTSQADTALAAAALRDAAERILRRG